MKLIFFTASYPYGIGQQWKKNELEYLRKYFSEIQIIPLSYGGNETPHQVPEGVSYVKPVLYDKKSSIKFFLTNFFSFQGMNVFISDFFEKKVYEKYSRLKSWVYCICLTRHLLKNPSIREILYNRTDDLVLYFYWGKGAAFIVPFIDTSKFFKVIARFHSGDLYEDRSNIYLPLRKALFQSLDNAVFISSSGLEYVTRNYPHVASKGKIFRLGVHSKGKAHASEDGVLRIVTCSFMVPVKRIHLLIEALRSSTINIEWTHIGDGPLRNELKDRAKTLPANVKVNWAGWVESGKVLDFYINKCVDLFINVSSSEGVPVSIMEALSAGIPVYATDVGGTGEIVDDSIGKLLPEDISPDRLAEEINGFFLLSRQEKESMRNRAFARFEEKCKADKVYEEFAKFIAGA